MKKMFAILGLVLVIALPMFANGTQESTTKTEAPSVNYNETGVLKLDWHASGGTDSLFECQWIDEQSLYPIMVFDTLLKENNQGTGVVPDLATDWKISDDGLTYTFTITDKATWHDGTPVTIDDVLFSYTTVLKLPKSGKKSYYKSVKGAQAVIDGTADSVSGITTSGNTITFELTVADNTVLNGLFTALSILPKHLLGDVDPTLLTTYEPYWVKPIGSGMYKIDEVSFPNYFTVVRNDKYFGEKPNIEHALFTSHEVGGVEATVSDIIAGNIDYAFGNAINDISTAQNIIANNPDIKMETYPGGYLRKFMFNLTSSQDGKYNDDVKKKEVRQAIRLLIDKESLASLYPEQGVVLTTMVNPKLSIYNSDIPLFKRDVAKAKSMLTEAGFDFSRPLRILYYYGDQTTKDLMDVVVQNFADAGVTAKPFLATGDLASLIYEVKNYDIIYLGGGSSRPIQNYSFLVPDSQFDRIIGLDDSRQLYGDLMQKYNSTSDPAEQKTIGDQLQAAAYDYAVMFAAYGLDEIVLYNAAKLKLPESIFDGVPARNYHIEKWELLRE